MKLLVIDAVNYVDYPTGGILSYYRTMLPPFGNDLILVGIDTEGKMPVGRWTKRTIMGVEYDYYTIAHVVPNAKRPIIPDRITATYIIWKHLKNILQTAPQYDYIFTQSPEALSLIPKDLMKKVCFVSAGMGNPLSISRYTWARCLAKAYDKFYHMPKVSKVRWHLAASDRESMEEFARRSGGLVKADDIISFPTRYNDEYFMIKSQSECRERVGFSEDVRLFVTVGRLNWFKGWKLMLDAFLKYFRRDANSVLLFIGDGEEEQNIRTAADDAGIGDKVQLVGKKAPCEIADYLNAADVFVMGSFEEGWSTTLVEACACGVPCVVTNFSSSKEMVQDGENGYVVMNRNPEVFAARMSDCLNLDRAQVRVYDMRFSYLAQSKMKEELGRILKSR